MVDGAVKRDVRTFKRTTKDLIALSEWTAATFGYSAFFDCGSHDFRVPAEPVRLVDELAIVDPENLHSAARFVIGRGNLKRRRGRPK
jgi:hypothetical protein